MASRSTDSTAKKKAAFLARLCAGHSVTAGAKAIKVDRKTVYNWRDADEDFAQAWADAWESGGDWYEDQNREQAKQGNMAAILNGLRMHKRIVDRHEHTGPDGGPIHYEVSESDREALQRLIGRQRRGERKPEPRGGLGGRR